MKKLLFACVAVVAALSLCGCKSSTAVVADDYRYELENVKGSSTAGYVTVKVWSYGRRERLTKRKCMANAVHGILFKGLDADETGTLGRIAPMVPGGYASNSAYFDNFFKEAYMQYVQESSKGSMAAGDIIKMSKSKEVKMGMVVKINMNSLRSRLENDGILTGVRGLFSNPNN